MGEFIFYDRYGGGDYGCKYELKKFIFFILLYEIVKIDYFNKSTKNCFRNLSLPASVFYSFLTTWNKPLHIWSMEMNI